MAVLIFSVTEFHNLGPFNFLFHLVFAFFLSLSHLKTQLRRITVSSFCGRKGMYKSSDLLSLAPCRLDCVKC